MRRKAAIMGLLAVAGWWWTTPARAGSLEMLGASSRGTAMGGAMVSIADGWEATYYNPSALALSRNSSSVQFSVVSGELMQNEENSLGGGYSVKFGINRRYFRDRVGLGLIVGTSNTGGGGLSFDLSMLGGGGPPNWNWQMYQDGSPLVFSLGVGVRITDWLSVGVSANQRDTGMVSLYYQLAVDQVLPMLIGIGGLVPTNIRGMAFSAGADPDSQITTGFNVTLRLSKYVSFGYVYKPEAWTRLKAHLELGGGPGGLMSETEYILLDMKIPGQVETTLWGVAGHIPLPWNDGILTFSYARETQNWDDFYPSSVSYTFYATDIFGPNWFKSKKPRDPGLENISIDRYGFEYEGNAEPLLFGGLKRLSGSRFYVRGGYYHWDSPQKENPTYDWQLAMVDADAEVYSFGVGFSYERKIAKSAAENPLSTPRLQIDFHFQQTVIEEQEYKFEINEWGLVPLDNYRVRTKGNISQYGVQVTWWQ